MSARTTPRMGRAVDQLREHQYAAFYAGHYRGERNTWLVLAKVARDAQNDSARTQRIRFAINAHRSMMRCLSEARREQREAA